MGRERALVALLLVTAVGCDRASAKEPPPSPTTRSAPTAPTRIVVPTQAAPIVAAPEVAAPAAPAAAREVASTPAAKPKAPRKGVIAAAPPEAAPSAPPEPTPPPPEPTPFTPRTLVADKLFRIELAPLAPCKPAATCEATLVVHALGGYKVNAEYPSKFVATASPGITVLGTGTFVVSGKTTGTMTVTFRAAAAGTSKLTGALKLSVCTDDICEIAAPAIAFDVPVT